jgi:cytochrome P450
VILSTSTETVGVFEWLKTMRETKPVYQDDQGAWQLFRYADVHAALFDAKRFSSNTTPYIRRPPEFDRLRAGNIIVMDEPQHRRLRGLIVDVFTPRVIDALTPRINAVAAELLDAADGTVRFDLVETLTYPLPVIVIAELLGVPIVDRPLFARWADAILSIQNPGRRRAAGP